MPLTQEQINFQALRASWYIEIDNHRQVDGGDVWVVTGMGVNDLDRLLGLMPTLRVASFRIDIGTQYESWVPITVTDVQAIRTAFIEFYGTVSKPGYHPIGERKFMKLADQQVSIQVQT